VTEVHHGPGVYCGPPDVYRGPCMKNMCWKTPIIFTHNCLLLNEDRTSS